MGFERRFRLWRPLCVGMLSARFFLAAERHGFARNAIRRSACGCACMLPCRSYGAAGGRRSRAAFGNAMCRTRSEAIPIDPRIGSDYLTFFPLLTGHKSELRTVGTGRNRPHCDGNGLGGAKSRSIRTTARPLFEKFPLEEQHVEHADGDVAVGQVENRTEEQKRLAADSRYP